MFTESYEKFLREHYEKIIKNFENAKEAFRKTRKETINDLLAENYEQIKDLERQIAELREENKILRSLRSER